MLLIIGSGNISDHLKFKISKKKIDFDFISYRKFVFNYNKINNYDIYKKIIFLGYNQNNFLLNVIKFYRFIKLLKKKKVNSHILFFNTQYTFIHKINKNKNFFNNIADINSYTTYKIICSKILKKSNLNYSEVYLPIVYNIENNQNFFLEHLALSDNIVIPNRGKNFNFFLEVDKLTIFLTDWIENKIVLENCKMYFLYSYYDTILNFIYKKYKRKIKNIFNTKFDNAYNLNKKKLIFFFIKKIIKNYLKFFLIKIKKHNKKSINKNIFSYRIKNINYLYPNYNFFLNFNLDKKKINKEFKILVI